MSQRQIVVYGHLNLNLLDGSAIWLTSLVETLAKTNSTVHLLLRARVTTDRLVKRVSGIPNVVVHDGVTTPDQHRLSDPGAISRLEELVQDVGAEVLITRGLGFCAQVARSEILAPILWSYVTDFSFPSHLMGQAEKSALRTIASRSQRLFLQTEESRSYVEALIEEAYGKTLLMRPTIPDDLFQPLSPKPDSHDLRLVYAGKFHPHWRTLEMLSLPSLLKERGVQASLTMLGDKFQGENQWSHDMRDGLQSAPGVHWGGGVSREEVLDVMSASDVGLSWRTADLDNSLEISTKLLEYAAAGTPPVANRTRAHEALLGADYPLLLEDDSTDEVLRVLAFAQSHLEDVRHTAQQAARRYSSSVTAARLERYLVEAEVTTEIMPLRGFSAVLSPGVPDEAIQAAEALGSGDRTESPTRAVYLTAPAALASSARAADVGDGPTVLFVSDKDLDSAALSSLSPDKIDLVTTCSEQAAQRLKARQGWEASDVRCLPSAIDTTQADRPKLPGSEYRIALLDLLPSSSRPDMAVRLLDGLLKHDPRFHLCIYAKLPWQDSNLWADGVEYEYYQSLFAALSKDSLREHVTIMTPGSEFLGWLRSTGWILARSQDNWTESTLVAMASGCAPLLHGPSNAVDERVSSFTYADVGAMVQSIVEHVSAPDRLTDAQASARALVADHDRPRAATRWAQVLKDAWGMP